MFCNPNQMNRKKVRFSPFIRVCPNPTFIEQDSISTLWWTKFDKIYAYSTMNNEIKILQRNHPAITFRQAMKLLYQPDNLTRYDPNNFIF
jgi:hypothetical protein